MKKNRKTHAADKPEKKYIDLLQRAFLLAAKICLTAAGRRLGLSRDDLIDFIHVAAKICLTKEAMDDPGFAEVNHCGFEGWPKTPGITFSIFARDSARELAGAFVAKVAELLHAADRDLILFQLLDRQAVKQKELDGWAASAFLKLDETFDLKRPAEFSRDCESLGLKLEAEAEIYFAKPQDTGGGQDETPKKREHSEDFTSILWDGHKFSFTKTQAHAVKSLWAEYEKGTWILGQETIGELVESAATNFRLVLIFEKGNHPAWGTLIIPGAKKGTFRLADEIQKKPVAKQKSVKKLRKK